MRSWRLGCGLLVLGCGAPSCSLVQMPFRVAGSMAQHSYKAAEKAVAASSQALDDRNHKKEAAKKARNKGQDSNKDKPQDPAQPAEVPVPAPKAASPVPPPVPPPPPLGADPATLPPLPDNVPPRPAER